MTNTTTSATTADIRVDLYRTTYRQIGIFPFRWFWLIEKQYATSVHDTWYPITSGITLTKRAAIRRAARVVRWRKTASTTEVAVG